MTMTPEQQVSSVHPGWEKLVISKDFKLWQRDQIYKVRRLADSLRAMDAIKLIDMFKDMPGRAYHGD